MTTRRLRERVTAALADRYAIGEELGHGGSAVVFRASDLRHGREVAVKVLYPEVTAVLGRERFLREIEIAAGLAHPHILPLYDSGEAEGLLFHVTPLLRGQSLRERLDRERMLPVEEALRIAGDLLDALAHAHGHGIVHRDVKPSNVFLTDRHALLADFGVARALERSGGTRLTETGVVLGTPAYMSPEQASGEPLDHRSDLYSTACTICEMLVGEAPFAARTPQAAIARRLTEDLIIADGDGPVALAGVMGLASSQVDVQTKNVLLESAYFAPSLVRACSRRLGPVSESSYRFEREADWNMVRFAAHRAFYLFQEVCGATIVGEAIDRTDPDFPHQR
ncbi:MAG: phenylalanine--tRNA ligase beta subunit-related protein, partial [Gemmatimonadota bacterium]